MLRRNNYAEIIACKRISQQIPSLFQTFRTGERQRNVKRKHLFYIAARLGYLRCTDIARSY